MKSANCTKWEGRWDQLKGKARKLWGQITDDELEKAQGDYEQVIGLIKERTGRTYEEIDQQLNA